MKSTHKQQLDAALTDIRKAYRLLHDYQRMVMDAVDYIGKQLGLSFAGGYSKYSNTTPRDGRARDFNYWAWDWLNMMFYEFHFTKELGNDSTLKLAILAISDTGYFCAENERLEKTKVGEYVSADQSYTRLAFIISAKEWDMSFAGSKSEMKTLIETGELPAKYGAKGIASICVELARIVDENETNALIDDVSVVAKRSGIQLSRVGAKQQI